MYRHPADVNVEYRRNLAAYQEWEEQVRAEHEQAIKAFKKRERSSTGVPRWLVTLAALAALGSLVWTFRHWIVQ